MNYCDVLWLFCLQLADRLQEWPALYVTNRPTNFVYYYIRFGGCHVLLYFVNEMRNYLHRLTQVTAFALFFDYPLVYLPRGYGIVARKARVGKPLIVSKI